MKGDSMTAVVRAAAELKRSSPEKFDAFLKSMIDHADRSLRDMLAAGRDGVHGAQGRAQALDDLAKKLENCIQLDEQYSDEDLMASVRREQAPPIDPDLAVPRAVREAAERATEAQRVSIGDAEPSSFPSPMVQILLRRHPPAIPAAGGPTGRQLGAACAHAARPHRG